MAAFNIIFRNADKAGNLVVADTAFVIGAKQSRKWVRETYGVDSREYQNNWDFYYVRHKNRFGIIWIVRKDGRYDIATNGKGESITKFAQYSVK